MLSWLAAWHKDDLHWEEPIQMAPVPLTRLIPPALAFCSLHTDIWMLLHLVTSSTLQSALPGLHRDSLCVQQEGMAAPKSSVQAEGKPHPEAEGSSPADRHLPALPPAPKAL